MSTKLLLHMDGDQSTSVSGVDGYTKLLLHMDDTGLTDSSLYNHTTTNNGADVSDSESVFGGYSGYFNGSTDYLSIPDSEDWNFGTGDFTIDFWVRFPTSVASMNILSQSMYTYDGSKYFSIGLTGASLLNIQFYDDSIGTTIRYDMPSGFVVDTWYHLAFVRNGSNFYFFIDGISQTINPFYAIGSQATGNFTGPMIVGGVWTDTYGFASAFTGYIDELRISKGIARWTNDFTLATEAYNAHNITVNGDPKLDTSTKKFGSSSMYFDGSGDYLTIPNSSDWDFDGDFTIDFWFRDSVTDGAWHNMFGTTDSYIIGAPDAGWVVSYNDDYYLTLSFDNGSANDHFIYRIGTETYAQDTWYHIAFVRNGGVVKAYINGVYFSNSYSSTNQEYSVTSSNPLIIGSSFDDTFEFNGHIDELRISKGIARWTSDFSGSLPSSEYTTDANTKLLLHFNSDVSGQDHEITFNGDPQIVVAPTKWNGSYYFDGVDDYLTIPDSDDWDLAGGGDYTIDFWVRLGSVGSGQIIITQWEDNSNKWECGHDVGNGLIWGLKSGGTWVMRTNYGPSDQLADLDWHHVALVKDGSDYKIYVDGTYSHSDTWAGTDTFSSGLEVAIQNTSEQPMHGHIDELRISDEALWTENFSVPSSPGVLDFYRLSGNLSDEVRILALNESSWAITENTTASGSGWSIDFDNDEAHTIIARKSDGESQGYGDMSPALV